MEKSVLESFAVNLKTVENELGTFSLGKVLGHGGTSVVREATLGGLSNKKFERHSGQTLVKARKMV